ncbi:MAG TPA: PEGA domain-containing protein [Polyangium sp.]|nr:PEGA domain-containing protein [Polyangium sp.]
MRNHRHFQACVIASWFFSAQVFAQTRPLKEDTSTQDLKAQAVARFETGIKYFDAGSLELALVEFLESRRLYPLRTATANAIVCMDQLGRHDEALELVEVLLRDFGATMPADARERAQRKVIELRQRVGMIEITSAKVGSTILLDGRERGQYPLLEPLRVKAGGHLLRVIMLGFEPFETQVDIAGNGVANVEVKQRALVRSGTLAVVEQAGKKLDVVVDGVVVGKTPWQGVLPLGEHIVLLRGEERLGTLPTPIAIAEDKTTQISLVAEALNAQIRIEPSPANAMIALDGITLGRGIWEGALRAGEHRIEVTAPDFMPQARKVTIGQDERKTLTLVLQRDPRSLFAVQKPHLIFDGNANLALAPTFGGDIGRGLGWGGLATLNAGYELSSHFSFGVSGGSLLLNQSVPQRVIAAVPVELVNASTTRQVLVNDHLVLEGLMAGGWGGFTFGQSFLVQLRAGAGAFFGIVSDRRRAGSALEGAWSMDGETTERHPVRAAYANVEIRFGWKIGAHLSLGAGLSIVGMYNPALPVWDGHQMHGVVLRDPAGSPNYGFFQGLNESPERLLSSAELAIVPGLGLRYDM